MSVYTSLSSLSFLPPQLLLPWQSCLPISCAHLIFIFWLCHLFCQHKTTGRVFFSLIFLNYYNRAMLTNGLLHSRIFFPSQLHVLFWLNIKIPLYSGYYNAMHFLTLAILFLLNNFSSFQLENSIILYQFFSRLLCYSKMHICDFTCTYRHGYKAHTISMLSWL